MKIEISKIANGYLISGNHMMAHHAATLEDALQFIRHRFPVQEPLRPVTTKAEQIDLEDYLSVTKKE